MDKAVGKKLDVGGRGGHFYPVCLSPAVRDVTLICVDRTRFTKIVRFRRIDFSPGYFLDKAVGKKLDVGGRGGRFYPVCLSPAVRERDLDLDGSDAFYKDGASRHADVRRTGAY